MYSEFPYEFIIQDIAMLSNNEKFEHKKWQEFLKKTQERQTIKSLYGEYKSDLKISMNKYYNDHCKLLEEYLSYYNKATSTKFFCEKYILLHNKDLKIVLSQCKVMILTANPIEKALFHYFITLQTNERIRRIICDNAAYFILKWGKYWVAHVPQIETGAYKDFGANASIHEALKYFNPNVIISLGVAFGIDYETQNIGDVIVSKRILPYSENKRDEDNIKPDRTQDKMIDNWLHVRFLNANGFLKGITYGDILTGGSVMSSFDEKDKICLGYTKADFIVGGEMEGNALFQYAKTDRIPCAVIKGICDWGVAKNDIFDSDKQKEEKFKDSLQAFAMAKAIEKCVPLFSDRTLFNESKGNNVRILKKRYNIARISLNLSLFLIFLIGFSFSNIIPIIGIRLKPYIGIWLIGFFIVVSIINTNLPQWIWWRIKCKYSRLRMNKEILTHIEKI